MSFQGDLFLVLGSVCHTDTFLVSESCHVAFQINRMEHIAPCKLKVCPNTHPRPPAVGLKGRFLLNVVFLDI